MKQKVADEEAAAKEKTKEKAKAIKGKKVKRGKR